MSRPFVEQTSCGCETQQNVNSESQKTVDEGGFLDFEHCILPRVGGSANQGPILGKIDAFLPPCPDLGRF